MTENCVFCKIVKGEMPSYKIHEDNDVLVFLDIKPLTKGHCLVIPKRHFENIFDIDKNTLEKVINISKEIAMRLKNTSNADGIRLSQSNEKAAGQEIMHFHLHVIPRYNNDGLSANPTATLHLPEADMQELKEISEQLKF